MVAIFTGAGAGFTRSSANLLGGAGQLGGALLGRGSENVSVNAASGNLVIARQDEFLIGLGPDAAIGRTYNSQADAADGDNGDNWQQSTTRRVFGLAGTLNQAGSTVSRLGADGAVVVYTWDAARSAYATQDGAGAFDTLTCVANTWTWRDGDTQATETYADHGGAYWRIVAAADSDGNALTFSYVAASDKLDKVTTADGGWVQYGWTGNAVTSVVTGYTDLATSAARTLTRVRYGYDASGRLETVTTDLSPNDNSVADNNKYVIAYTYHGTSNRVASISQSDGSLLQVAYDGSNRVQSLTQTVASGVSRVTTLTYGANHTTVTGPDGQVTRLDYDSAQRLTKVTAPPAASGATAQTVQFAYDASGNLDTVTDGNGKITSYDYDANGNATLITDPNGNTVQRTYDAANRLVTELAYGSDEGSADAAHFAQYAYDAEGHLRFAVNAAGQVTEYRYTSAGALARTIAYAEHTYPVGPAEITATAMASWAAGLGNLSSVKITENTYDARGGLVSTKAYGIANAAGEPLATDGTTTVSFVYDHAGNLIDRYRPGENHETFLHDGMGRLVSSTDKNGGTTTIVFTDAATTTVVTSAAGLSTTSIYNKAGDLVSVSESGGTNINVGTAAYAYDSAGRLRVATDASGRSSYTYYDKAGRKVAEVNHLGEMVEYRYDAAGRVAAIIAYSTAIAGAALTTVADPAASAEFSTLRPTASAADVWTWTIYDGAGRAVQTIDNLGSTATFAYDKKGRLVSTTAWFNKLSAGTLAGFKTTLPTAPSLPASHAKDTVSRLFYNKAGQQRGALDGEGFLSETVYDSAGYAIKTVAYATATNAGDRAAGTFATLRSGVTGSPTTDRVSHSVYDGAGLLRYAIDAKGGIASFTYDSAGRLTKTTIHATQVILPDLTFDAVKSAVVSRPSKDRVSQTVYDAAGRVAYTIDSEQGVVKFGYDTSGRVVKAIAYDNLYSGGVSLSGLDTWTAAGAQANDSANRVTRNWYNARGELAYSLDGENFITGHVYDSEGRATSTTRFGGSGFVASDATTLAAVHAAASGVAPADRITVTNAYDNAGRVLSVTDGENVVTRNAYNALGQLTDVIEAYGSSDEVTTRLTYDGAGRVLTETSAFDEDVAATVTYAYDGLGNRVTVTDARGNATGYTFDKLGRVLTATDALTGVTTYVYDAFDNVVKVTSPAGKSTFTYYDTLSRAVVVRDAENYVTKTTYSRFGDVLAVQKHTNRATGTAEIGTLPSVSGQATNLASYYYDRLGRVILKVDAEGYVETTGYNAFGQVTRFTRYQQTSIGVPGVGATEGDIQDAYDDAADLQIAANNALAAAVQAAANAQAAAAAVPPLQTALNTSQANVAALQAVANQAAAAAASAQADANAAQAAADAAFAYHELLITPGEVQAAYDAAAQAQVNADNALAAAVQAAAAAAAAAAAVGPLQSAANASQAHADTLQATADQAAADAAQARTDADDAHAAAAAAWAYVDDLQGPSAAEIQAAYDAAAALQATADTAQAAADQAAANAATAQANVTTAQATAASAQTAYNSAVSAYNTATANHTAAQNAANSAQTTSNASAAAASSALTNRNNLATQLSQNAVAQAYATPIPPLQAAHTVQTDRAAYYANLASQTSDPAERAAYLFVRDTALAKAQEINAEITSVQAGNPLSANGKTIINTHLGFTTAQLNTYQTLANNHAAAVTAYNNAAATAASDLAAYNAAQANANQKLTLKNQANTAKNNAQTALTNAQAAVTAAQTAATQAASAATQAQATANTAQAAADNALAEADLLAASGNPTVLAAYQAAAQAQQAADALDAQATAAEAAAVQAQTAAAAAAQAADDADDLVADIQAQIAALGSGGVNFSAQRSAALADMTPWLLARRDWLDDAEADARVLEVGSSGARSDEFETYGDWLTEEYAVVQDLYSKSNTTANLARKAAYINQYYDNLTWRAANLAADKATALANPLAWLIDRRDDLVDRIERLDDLEDAGGYSSRIDNAYAELKLLWARTHIAIYDLTHNTYSDDWPTSATLYSQVQANPNYVPSGIDHNSGAPNTRALIRINAYFDLQGAAPQEWQDPAVLLQAQLTAALAAADAAHDAADAASAAATTSAASATGLRTNANQAQLDADAALDYAEQLEANLEDPATLQAAIDAANAAQAAADAAEAVADQHATDAAQAQGDADDAQVAADADQAALVAAQQTASQAATASTQAQSAATAAQTAADAALAHAQQLEVGQASPAAIQAALDAANQAQADADDAQGGADQAATDAADAQADVTAAQAIAAAAQTALAVAQTAASQAATAATQAQNAATAAQASADAALLAAQELEDGPPGGINTSVLGAADTLFQYDERGLLTRTTDAAGWVEGYAYNAFGQRVTLTAKNSTEAKSAGGATTYEYYKNGLLKSETLPVQSYNSAGTALGAIKKSYVYDKRGNLTQLKEADGLPEQRITTFTFDKLDRKLTATGASFTAITFNHTSKAISYATGAPTEQIAYDANGNVIRTTDAAGARTVFFYDQLNRKTVEINALGTYTRYTYNADGNVTSIKVFETTVTVPANGGASTSAPSEPSGNKRETAFEYDALGQLTKSSVILGSGYKTGVWNGSGWSNASTSQLDTHYVYDYLGNVVKVTDPNGNATFSYYDRLSRKTAQLDAQGYLTSWTYTYEGNVESERRWATRYTSTPNTSGPPTLPYTADDRVTNFAYDNVGNRTAELRYYVKSHAGNGTNTAGNTTSSVDTATILYFYNGLGQVVRKTEATNDQFNYVYDAAGRLIQETRPMYASNTGANVTPRVDHFYDGLGNLVRDVQAAGGDAAAARVTRYNYGPAGQLYEIIDAENKSKFFRYDIVGRRTMEYYDRTFTALDGSVTTVGEGTGYRYDALGRSVGQGLYVWVSNWTFQANADYTTIGYNAFGDVVAVANNRTQSQISSSGWQQENRYDVAGRLWATNAGDGIWKYFGYDNNGNQTLAITGAGEAMAGLTLASAFAKIGQANVNGTYTIYDKRNLAVQIYEEGRQRVTAGSELIGTGRSYNAFGEVATETDAIGAVTSYAYNTMGRLLRKEGATVEITMEDGTKRWVKPAEDYYYDKSGRLVAMRDANGTYAANGTSANGTSKALNTGNLTLLTLLAGTGYGGSEALVLSRADAGGGINETAYNIFGDARRTRTLVSTGSTPAGNVWRTTDQVFDNLGRLTKATRAGGLIDSYAYDNLDRVVEHGNNVMSAVEGANYLGGNTEITVYDVQGRISATRAWGGDVTTNTYTWQSAIAANGMPGTAPGGWRKLTTYANSKTLTEDADLFGRIDQKTDLGGHITDYTYDAAGRLTISQIGSASYRYEYYNTGHVSKAYSVASAYVFGAYPSLGYHTATQQTSEYTYDAVGNRKTEYGTYTIGGTVYAWKNQSANYDMLGRLQTIDALPAGGNGHSTMAIEYDANGNVRMKRATFHTLSALGAADTSETVNENWYLYDSMNRVVLNDGVKTAGQIVRRAMTKYPPPDAGLRPSEIITYNKAGDRMTSAMVDTLYEQIGAPYVPVGYYEIKNTYDYDAAGRLARISQAVGAQGPWTNPTTTPPNPPPAAGPGPVQSSFTYDGMGRQLTQTDHNPASTTAPWFNTITSYNAKGQVQTQFTSSLKTDGKTYTSNVTNDYGSGAAYALGAVVSSISVNTVTGGPNKTTSTTNEFEWWDGALQHEIEYDKDTAVNGTNDITTFTYTGLGQLNRASIADGMARTVTFTLDELGQIVRRDETRPSNAPSAQTGSPHELWHRFGEREFGYISNNEIRDLMAQEAIAERRALSGTGTFRNRSTSGYAAADFTQTIDRLNSYGQGSTAGSYTAEGGETLQQIAQRLYGDAGLWYKIAEANGMSAGSTLAAGQQLVLPGSVIRNTHSADSYRPYDPANAIGDLSPTAPKPNKGNKCGFVGTIISLVVAVASSYLFGPIAGNLVSQGFNNLVGLQSGFSFKSFGLAVISAGVNVGLSELGSAGGTLGKVGEFLNSSGPVNDFARGVVANGVSQGIGVATGLQDKFDWAGVAAAGISSLVGGATVRGMTRSGGQQPSGFALDAVSGGASLIANAATRSALEGSSFGDNLRAGLPDVIGQVLGGIMRRSVAAASAKPKAGAAGGSTQRLAIEDAAPIAALPPAQQTAQLQAIAAQIGTSPIVAGTQALTRGEIVAGATETAADLALVERNLVYGENGSSAGFIAASMNPADGSAFLTAWAQDLRTWPSWEDGLSGNVGRAADLLWNGMAAGQEALNLVKGAQQASGPGMAELSGALTEKYTQWAADNPLAAFAFSAGRFSTGTVSTVLDPLYRLGGNVIYGTIGALSGSQISDFSLSNLYNPARDMASYGWSAVTGQRSILGDSLAVIDAGRRYVSDYSASFGADRAEYGLGYALSARATDLGTITGTIGSAAIGGQLAVGGRIAVADTAVSKGWSVGGNIYALTSKGNEPAWSTVRGRFWKNEAVNPQYGTWNAQQLNRMGQGLAPQRHNFDKGGIESMDLSHEPMPFRDGGRDVIPRWPQDHAAVDPYRRPGY